MAISDPLRVAMKIAALRVNQWKSRAELEEMQDVRLRGLLKHARENVPHYKKSFGDAALGGLDSLGSLPILEKADIRSGGRQFISRLMNPGSLYKFRTTGTTGEALEHYMDHNDSLAGTALRQHSLMQCGFAPQDKLVSMTYSRTPGFFFQPLIFRTTRIEPWADYMRGFHALKAAKPDILLAYPSMMLVMAEANAASGNRLRIKKAISVSEALRERAKKAISDSFGCQIRNYYAANECWGMAWECGKGSLHVNSDEVIVECVDERGEPVAAGKSGKLLITPLWRRSMPFIRYDIGDRGSLGVGCSCGRNLPIIKSLEGRTTDFIILPSGGRIPWIFVEIPLYGSRGFLSYQVIQQKDGSLDVSVIPAPGAGHGVEERLRSLILSSLPERLEVRVKAVSGISRGARGKMRDFISRIIPPP